MKPANNKSINQTAGTPAALRGKFIGTVWLYFTLSVKSKNSDIYASNNRSFNNFYSRFNR